MKSDREILKEAFGVYVSHRSSDYARAASLLVEYMKREGKSWRDLIMAQYMLYLLAIKGPCGFYYRPSWVVNQLRYARTFGHWLVKEGYFKDNPFAPFAREAVEKRANLVYEKRIKSLYERNGRWKDGSSFVEDYLLYAEDYFSLSNVNLMRRSLLSLKKYCQGKGLSWREVTEKEAYLLLREWIIEEIHPSVKYSLRGLVVGLNGIRNFYRYLYEQGYLKEEIFFHWRESYLVKMVEKVKREWESSRKLKKRRYSSKEIYKAYRVYLWKTYKHYDDFNRYLGHFRHFLRFCLKEKRKLYDVDRKLIESYKEYLLDYEYAPGCFYRVDFMAFRIHQGVKRFFDWFVAKDYLMEHPYSDFSLAQFKKELKGKVLNRKSRIEESYQVPEAYEEIFDKICRHEVSMGLAKGTVYNHQKGWKVFFHYLGRRKILDVTLIDERILEDFMSYVHQLKNRKGGILSVNTRLRHLVGVKCLLHYLFRFRYLNHDPSWCITLPKAGRGLPTVGVSHKEMRKILGAREVNTAYDVRDVALLMTLYSTGVRSNELRHICVEDVDFNHGLVRINVPKGGLDNQRVVPIGEEALRWVDRYIREVRKASMDCPYLFVNSQGGQLSGERILKIVKTFAFSSGLRKNVVTHSMRVACGTEMLRNKADLKFVQMQLGHRSILSTEKYMRLVPSDLKKIHQSCHPMEKRKKKFS